MLKVICKNPWFIVPAFLLLPWLLFVALIMPFDYISPFFSMMLIFLSGFLIGVGFGVFLFFGLTAGSEKGVAVGVCLLWVGIAGTACKAFIPEAQISTNKWVVYNNKLYNSTEHNNALLNMEKGSYKLITGMSTIASYDVLPTGQVSAKQSVVAKGVKAKVTYAWQPEFVKQNLDEDYVALTDRIVLPLIQNNPKGLNQVQLAVKVCKATDALMMAVH